MIASVDRDERPTYVDEEGEVAGVVRELSIGVQALLGHPALRLSAATLIVLLLFEGFADVLLVVMALELLHLDEGSVGFLNASWGLGALIGGASLALLLDRGKLVVAHRGRQHRARPRHDAARALARGGDRLRRLAGGRARLHARRGRGQDAD